MSTPQGWDDIPEEIMSGARELRKVYIALIAAGFTTDEASRIIAHMCRVNEGS